MNLSFPQPLNELKADVLVSFLNVRETRVICEEETTAEEPPPSDWTVTSCVAFFFKSLIDVGGPCPPWAVPFLSRWA